MTQYPLDDLNRFILPDFQSGKPFSGFLPGIAGRMGIPMWVFYVNRGQAVTSFGIESKDHPMMEFQPANKAYQTTPLTGFRTFIKVLHPDKTLFYEPFSQTDKVVAERVMKVGLNDLVIQEKSLARGIEIEIHYFLLPEEEVPGLVRLVKLQNTCKDILNLEVLDGIPAVIPYGISNYFLKEMNRTMEAWMEVFHLDTRIPHYHVRASVEDSAEVARIQAGHYALAFAEQNGSNQLLFPLVDPALVFGSDTSLQFPEAFQRRTFTELCSHHQVTCGRTPCGFFAWQGALDAGESVVLNSIYGFVDRHEDIRRIQKRLLQPGFLSEKHHQALALTQELTDVIATTTANQLFDAYTRQTFLDNVLRGGWPLIFKEENHPTVFHIFGRKHGDIERDYNFFTLTPEFYSQGNGAYRDINQNRRCDVLINPRVGDFNVRSFMSLIQADGYNPLSIQGSSFTLTKDQVDELMIQFPQFKTLENFLLMPFTPGKLLHSFAHMQGSSREFLERFFKEVFQLAQQQLDTTFGEGYWIDHWTYNLDQIESYLAVFPDHKEALLFEQADIPFYDSPAIVLPRCRKYLLANGRPIQFGSVVVDREKRALISARSSQAQWVRTRGGFGEVYTTTLFTKLVLLALLKFTTLDPMGMGIEMEAGKPGWYDALNGLPGLFGSGMPETFELRRLLDFLQDAIRRRKKGSIRLPREAYELLKQVKTCLDEYQNSQNEKKQFLYWEAVSTARESYREKVRLGFEGKERKVSFKSLKAILAIFQVKVDNGIQKALSMNEGIPPTYISYQAKEYEPILVEAGKPSLSADGRPLIRVLQFEPQMLPLFLEGAVRAMKILPTVEEARELYREVRASALFDYKLKMYKVNAPLTDQPPEIGRARSFPPGWLENESIWLHMEYKYLLEILKAGLYEEFFSDLRQTLIPFLDTHMYGRSLLENSSFLASSAFPDESRHGTGYVARLSGSTAEFLSIWTLMMAGPQPFKVRRGQLCLELRPALPGWLFDKNGQVSFKFLGSCEVIYHNSKFKDTYAPHSQARSTILHLQDGKKVEIPGSRIEPPYSQQVREYKIRKIEIYYDEA